MHQEGTETQEELKWESLKSSEKSKQLAALLDREVDKEKQRQRDHDVKYDQ